MCNRLPNRLGTRLLIGIAVCFHAAMSHGEEGKPYPDPARFEKAIQAFETSDAKNSPPVGAIVCVGSSSMVGWRKTIAKDLAPLTVIPRGFGGSNMNDLLHYTERVVLPYRPRAILVYEGDNDIARSVDPKQVRDTFAAFVEKVAKALPETRIYFISIKPSIKRWAMWPQMQTANALIKEICDKNALLTYIDVASSMLNAAGAPEEDIFKHDNLHLNEKGYAIWTQVVKPVLTKTELGFEKQD